MGYFLLLAPHLLALPGPHWRIWERFSSPQDILSDVKSSRAMGGKKIGKSQHEGGKKEKFTATMAFSSSSSVGSHITQKLFEREGTDTYTHTHICLYTGLHIQSHARSASHKHFESALLLARMWGKWAFSYLYE